MTDIRCVFCGAVPDDSKDDCFVTDFTQDPMVSICSGCIKVAARRVLAWSKGEIEYRSWASESDKQREHGGA